MFASDIHGSAKGCRLMLKGYERECADKLILAGDILYHGPRNDLPDEYAPKQVAAMLNASKSSILCVRGNCEAEVDQMMLEFPCMADYAMLWIDNISVMVTARSYAYVGVPHWSKTTFSCGFVAVRFSMVLQKFLPNSE